MGTRRGWQVGFAAALLVQFWALDVPRPPSVDTGLPLDKVAHFALFAVVTWLAMRAGVSPRWTVGLMLAQAVLSETVQQLRLSQRGGDVLDLAADVVGIAAGWWLARRELQPADY